jgi:hypothetical protein
MVGTWTGCIYTDGDFEYDDDKHQYRLAGVVLPGVSTILTPIVDFGDAPMDKVRAAAVRGKHVHKACELWDAGDLDEDALDPVLVPYLAGWKAFRRDFGCQWDACEIPEYHPVHHYGGTPDRRGHWKKKRILVDLKATYKLNDSVEVQLAGYDLLDTLGPADELWSVRVTKNATYERHVHRKCHATFLSLLNIYKWRTVKGLTYPKW